MNEFNQNHTDRDWTYHVKRWIPTVIMLPIMIWLIMNRGRYTWIDNADLVVHEAGHFFFMFFGKFIYTLGGTLMQILLPSLIIWYFLRNSYRTGAQVGLLWLSQNLINISVYAADARAQALPLLGGNKVYHDWTYILETTNLLQYDFEVGYIFFGLAIIIFLITALLPLIFQE
jgi:hypothetical protein